MEAMVVGKWYKTEEILTKLHGTDRYIPIRCEVQLQEDGALKLRGEAATECFPD